MNKQYLNAPKPIEQNESLSVPESFVIQEEEQKQEIYPDLINTESIDNFPQYQTTTLNQTLLDQRLQYIQNQYDTHTNSREFYLPSPPSQLPPKTYI